MNYLILINEESKPVLVEVPQKPKHSYGASRSWEELDYKSKIDRVISDKSKHIQLKRNYVLSSLLVGAPWPSDKFLDEWLKEISGQTFPLPTGYKVSFEKFSMIVNDWINCDQKSGDNVRAILSKLEEEKVVAPSEEVKQDIKCPFCSEDGFDRIGLKNHLENNCKEYETTERI